MPHYRIDGRRRVGAPLPHSANDNQPHVLADLSCFEMQVGQETGWFAVILTRDCQYLWQVYLAQPVLPGHFFGVCSHKWHQVQMLADNPCLSLSSVCFMFAEHLRRDTPFKPPDEAELQPSLDPLWIHPVRLGLLDETLQGGHVLHIINTISPRP